MRSFATCVTQRSPQRFGFHNSAPSFFFFHVHSSFFFHCGFPNFYSFSPRFPRSVASDVLGVVIGIFFIFPSQEQPAKLTSPLCFLCGFCVFLLCSECLYRLGSSPSGTTSKVDASLVILLRFYRLSYMALSLMFRVSYVLLCLVSFLLAFFPLGNNKPSQARLTFLRVFFSRFYRLSLTIVSFLFCVSYVLLFCV